MPQIIKKHIAAGITWVEIKEADLFLCCGCPADTIKHLKKARIIQADAKDGWHLENGPNAILLSDTLIQNSKMANLSEFVILHMMYLQGLLVKGHPNYMKSRPLLIGYENQIKMQLEYVSVGNHGLEKVEEMMDAGMDRDASKKIYATKEYYAGGEMKSMDHYLDSIVLDDQIVEIKKGVSLHRTGLNKFRIYYKNESESIDLNLNNHEQYEPPYELPFKQLTPSRFSVIHTGEGNGWDIHRPCMASIIHFEGKVYLIDAGPNILDNLSKLGIGLSEIEGLFLSHIHDDHFAGITDLLNVEKKLKLFMTPLIKATAKKKLYALFNSEIDLLRVAFQCVDLEFDRWTNIDGLEVKPSYSPHTVETSIFKFRVKNDQEQKTYLHLADTINFKEFNIITKKYPKIFDQADIDYVRKNYLSKVDLKKLDVGGGAIHGHISDYKEDLSAKLVMAHTDHELKIDNPRFFNVGFGDIDHLIEDDDFDYLKIKSKQYFKKYFESLPDEVIETLIESKKVYYEPGERILPSDEGENIFLILSGLVYFTNLIGVEQRIDAGNFFGYSKKYFLKDYKHRYVSLSYVVCLQLKESYIDKIFSKYDLLSSFRKRINLTNSLRESYLVQHTLSGATYYDLAGASEFLEIPDQKLTDEKLSEYMFIIQEGSVKVIFEEKHSVDIYKNQHFGGLNLLRKYRRNQRFLFSNNIKAVSVPIQKLMQVPALLWKLIELEEKRYQLSIFEAQ